MPPDQPRTPSSRSETARFLGVIVGVALSFGLLLVLLYDLTMHGLTQYPTVPRERHLGEQAIALVLSIAGTILLVLGRPDGQSIAALLFGMAGPLMLWSAYVGSWRGAQVILAGGCFGLAALAFWGRSQP